MKVVIKKAIGTYADPREVGEVHLSGPIDDMACGLADEDYEVIHTDKHITCSTCRTYLEWAKKVAKIKN